LWEIAFTKRLVLLLKLKLTSNAKPDRVYTHSIQIETGQKPSLPWLQNQIFLIRSGKICPWDGPLPRTNGYACKDTIFCHFRRWIVRQSGYWYFKKGIFNWKGTSNCAFRRQNTRSLSKKNTIYEARFFFLFVDGISGFILFCQIFHHFSDKKKETIK